MATATINLTRGSSTSNAFPARDFLKTVGVASAVLDWAVATSVRGSALTTGDIVQLINLPPNTLVLGGVCEVITAVDNTAATVDIGTTGISADNLVDGGNVKTTGITAPGTNGSYGWTTVIGSSGDTIDVLIASTTGTITTGKIRVDVVIAQVQTANTV